MCMARIEDMYGSVGVTVFPRVYELNPELWAENTVVIMSGEVQMRTNVSTCQVFWRR